MHRKVLQGWKLILASETNNIHPHKLFVIHMGGDDLRDMRTYMFLEERKFRKDF